MKYGMVVEDHEVRIFPLDNMDVLEIPEDRLDEAHDLEDEGDSDMLTGAFGEEVRALKLWTVSVDSEDINEGEWNDLFYVWAPDEAAAKRLAELKVFDKRSTHFVNNDLTEAHAYADPTPRVLTSFDPNEED